MKTPANCHLWQLAKPAAEDLLGCFDTVEVFEDDSHDRSCLLKCKTCGQLYYYEFHEEVDWVEGNDPSHRLYIPVETRDEARMLLSLGERGLIECFPRLHYDWPNDRERPEVYWVGK